MPIGKNNNYLLYVHNHFSVHNYNNSYKKYYFCDNFLMYDRKIYLKIYKFSKIDDITAEIYFIYNLNSLVRCRYIILSFLPV